MADKLARIARVDGLGMVTIRAALARAGDAMAEAVGLAIPGQTRFTTDGSRWLGWMSPDELLLILPHAETADAIAALEQALVGEHALIADVSDMRVAFDIAGPDAWQVLAKLCPVDFGALPADGLRRTRAAQVAAALWRRGDGFRLIGMRSVAGYLAEILRNAAVPGSGLGPR